MTSKPREADDVTDAAADGLRSPIETVTRFLEALQSGDVDGVVGLAADEIAYTNVSLPTIHGTERFSRAVHAYYRRGLGFQVKVHRIAGEGSSVLTERTDAITFGSFRMQFWVCGIFEVEGGRITLWRDYFDWRNTTLAALRGLVGVVVPSVRAECADTRRVKDPLRGDEHRAMPA